MRQTQPLEPAASPTLTQSDRIAIELALRRLHESLRAFWACWPVERRTPTRISQELGVDRTTCQRVSALVRDRYSLEAMIDGMPGPRAVRGLADAAGGADSPTSPAVVAQLRSAADGFDELLRQTSGSLSRLKKGLIPPVSKSPEASATACSPQEAMFHAAHGVTHRRSLATASVGLYDLRGVGDGELRHIRASGNYGMTADPVAVPMVLEAFDGAGGSDEEGWHRSPVLLPGLTSAAWRPVQLTRSPGFSSQAMEIARTETPSDVYIYTAFPVADPRTLDNPVEESWFMIYSPTAALVFDIYLHRSIASLCAVSLDVHLWQTSFANSPHGKWHTRLPHAPVLTALRRGILDAGSVHHPNHAALTREVFERAGADAGEYVGFRCEERFPVWRAGYRFELDFGSPAV